jgi:hypothetical protein
MKKLFQIGIITAAALTAFVVSPVFAGPSSKFAADVRQAGEGFHLLHSGVAVAALSGQSVTAVDDTDNILEATIKTANKKDLLIGVSLQSSLFTDTTVKGKNGSQEKADAQAGIMVRVVIDGNPNLAAPNTVVFAKRVQELSATLGGVIKSCNFLVLDTDDDGTADSGEIVVARDCEVTDEEIGLMLTTTSANHFNFVAPNLGPGDHTVKVYAKALSSASFTNGTTPVYDIDGNLIGDAPTTNNESQAWALVQVGTLTVEEVRAVNQSFGITIDLDAGTVNP